MNKIVLPIMLLNLSACGLIIHEDSQRIGFSSNPSGAKATVEMNLDNFIKLKRHPINMELKQDDSCMTPCTLILRRDIEFYTVTFDKEGYETSSNVVMQKPSGWLWGNIIAGGLIGLTVDLVTGGGYKIVPDNIHTELIKK